MKRLATFLALFCVAIFASTPAMAQTILRDAETESMLAEISRPIIIAAGLSPNNVRVVMIQDPSINAFVMGGQTVYIHSGLIDKAGNANEVQGVIAHEIGHIVGGHAVFQRDGGYGGISIVSLLLGAVAVAAGAPEAGMGILMAGQRAAIGKYLAFSRSQESSADAAGVRFLNTAGISGKGMIEFFKRLQTLQYSYGYYNSNPEVDPFAQTHPMSAERISNLQDDLKNQPAWNTPTDAALEVRFKRVQAKLRGYVNDPEVTLQFYPGTDKSVYAHYARAYAYHRKGFPTEAAGETEALVVGAPNDPYFLELQGQIMLEGGDPRGALVPLRRATELSRNDPLIASVLGHALLATDDPSLLDEAERVLRAAVSRDTQNPFGWYQLGMVYERKGDLARTALATAERANLMGDARTALAASKAAMAGLPQGSRDWVRAQDIMMVSQTAMEDERLGRKRQRLNLGTATQ